MAEPEKPPDEPNPDWIETVVAAAGAVGLNKVRVRWKLQRWVNQRQAGRRRREQRVDHIRYQHKTCPNCGAVNDRNEKRCARCNEKLPSRTWQVLGRIGLSVPEISSVSAVLALAIGLVYLRTIMASGGQQIFSFSGSLLVQLGGNFPPLVERGESWRLLTAAFLHGGLWHIGFNLLALASIGPRIEHLYGRWQMLFLFVLTALIGNAGSWASGLHGVGIGASGGIMGLVGAAVGWGHRARTTIGTSLRDAMIKWCIYVFIFGYLVGADNMAHLFGLLPGLAIGWLVQPEWLGRRQLKWLSVITGGIGLTASCVAVVIIVLLP